jgi:hypothetical protein
MNISFEEVIPNSFPPDVKWLMQELSVSQPKPKCFKTTNNVIFSNRFPFVINNFHFHAVINTRGSCGGGICCYSPHLNIHGGTRNLFILLEVVGTRQPGFLSNSEAGWSVCRRKKSFCGSNQIEIETFRYNKKYLYVGGSCFEENWFCSTNRYLWLTYVS